MNSNEQRIREFAYQIWQTEGKPHGQAKRHWEMACKLAASDVQQSTSIASPKVKATSKKPLAADAAVAVAKPMKKTTATKTTATKSIAATSPLKADVAKKTKAKAAEKSPEATPKKLETKKPAAAKKNKITESQPT